MSGARGRRGAGGRKRRAHPERPSGRGLTVRVKSAKSRKIASTRWLERQLNDPYVAEAQKRGYRSRAAFKLLQLDEKYNFLGKAKRLVDLGSAPGGWLQVALEICPKSCRILGIDLNEVEALAGVELLTGDFLEPETPGRLLAALGGAADVVLSDMAANATGHTKTDHLRIMALAEVALDFAEEVLTPGGSFVAKVLQGGTEAGLLTRLKRDFAKVHHFKPAASRSGSAEMYLVALGFRGGNSDGA
jgi:23S rRNA (uridine2552-2'-O)-methyltransferase